MKKCAGIAVFFAVLLSCWAVWEKYHILFVLTDITKTISQFDEVEREVKSIVAVMESRHDPYKEEMREWFIDFGVRIHAMKENLLLVEKMVREDASFAHDFASSAEARNVLAETLQVSDDALEKIKQIRRWIHKDAVIMII